MSEADAGGEGPIVLSGWPGLKLLAWGAAAEGIVPFCAIAVVFESFFGRYWYLWASGFGCIAGLAIIFGLVTGMRGYRKLKRERRSGYTTSLPDAREDPSLYLLNPVTLAVISGPFEPRPDTLRKAFKLRELFVSA